MDYSLQQPCGTLTYGLLRPDASRKPSYDIVRNLLNPSNDFPNVVLPAFPPQPYDARFVSWSIPSSMNPGSTDTIAMTFANTGTLDWQMGSYHSGLLIRLGSRIPWDDSTWGVHRADLAPGETISPGASKTFVFPVTAPSTTGTYYIQWRLVREGIEWFGDESPVKIVNVALNGLTVALVSPTNGSVFSTQNTVRLIAKAAHDNAGIKQVEIFENGILLGRTYFHSAQKPHSGPHHRYFLLCFRLVSPVCRHL